MEEGMADRFADVAIPQMLGGADLSGYGRYQARAEGAFVLLTFLADGDEQDAEVLLLQSRAEPDVLTFLTERLKLEGVTDQDTDAILFYTSATAWRAVVRRVTGR